MLRNILDRFYLMRNRKRKSAFGKFPYIRIFRSISIIIHFQIMKTALKNLLRRITSP